MLSLAVFVVFNELAPTAVLLFAVVPAFNDLVPTAVLFAPAEFDCSATKPRAVLL